MLEAGSQHIAGVDLVQAVRFIEALTGDANTPVTFQTFDDDAARREAIKAEGKGDPFAQIRHGSLKRAANWLIEMNSQGAGVYVTVNATDGHGRKEKNVIALRALFVDDDEAAIEDPESIPLPPTIVVRAKRGLHLYWVLCEEQAIDGFRDAQKGLIHHLGTDTSIHDLPRVMRLPGFFHMKDPQAPHLVTLMTVDASRRYTLKQVTSVFPTPPEPERPASTTAAYEPQTDAAEMFARWAAKKSVSDGERHDALKAIVTEGWGRVNAGILSEEEALGVVLDYCRRSGIREGDRGGRKLWEHGRGKGFTANLPVREANYNASGSTDTKYGHGRGSNVGAINDGARNSDGGEFEEAGARPQRFRLYSPAELAELPPLEWQVDEIIPKRALITLFGQSGGGKTFIGLDLALSISLGRPWAGRVVKQGHVVYVSGEGISGLSQRVRAWQIHNDQMDPLMGIHFITEAVNLRNMPEVVELMKSIQSLPVKPDLVVLDTLARCLVGGDENSSKDMGEAVFACDYIRQHTGGAVMLVHHTNKDRADLERGSGALRGAMDTMVLVKNDDGLITVSCNKQKDASPFEETQWRLEPVDVVRSCVPVEVDSDTSSYDGAPEKRKGLNENQQLILNVVKSETYRVGGATFSEIMEISAKPKASVSRILDKLRNEGYIVYDVAEKRYHTDRSGSSGLTSSAGTENRNSQFRSGPSNTPPLRGVGGPAGPEQTAGFSGIDWEGEL